MKINKKHIQKTKENFWNFIATTPLTYSPRLSKKYDAKIYLKKENEQEVRSYKVRWAFNLINSLSEKEKKAWIVCASAWNHAQWVAITCHHLKIKGTIYMPITTPEQKVYKTKQFWWKYIDVVLYWDTFDEAYNESKKFEKKSKTTFFHPFDDKRIITWQATIWLEIYDSIDPDFIICPIWGWWLVSGIISITTELGKKTKIIGVEPAWAAAMKLSLEKWKNTSLNEIDTFVDGASVKKVWDITFKIAKEYKLPVMTCPENRVCSTMLEYLKEDGMVVEPAWALSTDALKDMKKEIKWKEVVIIISGSNFDFERIQEVKERKMKFEQLKRYFVVTFPQRPGALKDFLSCLWKHDDIARFEYLKKSNKNRAPAFIGIETDAPKNWERITKNMDALWFKYHDVTNDELYFDLLI